MPGQLCGTSETQRCLHHCDGCNKHFVLYCWCWWTSLQVFDESALSQLVKEELYKCYPDAKRAHLKDGGNFPYLSRSTEVDLHLQVNILLQNSKNFDHIHVFFPFRFTCEYFMQLAFVPSLSQWLMKKNWRPLRVNQCNYNSFTFQQYYTLLSLQRKYNAIYVTVHINFELLEFDSLC